MFCFCVPFLFVSFMLVAWGGCDKIYLVVIARIKLFGLMRGGVYILVNFLTLGAFVLWFLSFGFSGNLRACAFPEHVRVSKSWSICWLVSPACSCTLNFTAYSLGLPLVTASLVTVVPFSEHFTVLDHFGRILRHVLLPTFSPITFYLFVTAALFSERCFVSSNF